MKIKIETNMKREREYPCLLIDTSDNMILLAAGDVDGCFYGTIVKASDKAPLQYFVGRQYGRDDCFRKDIPFELFEGTLSLSND